MLGKQQSSCFFVPFRVVDTPGKEDAGESGKGQGNGDVPSRWKGRQKPVAQPVSVWSPQLTPTANTC